MQLDLSKEQTRWGPFQTQTLTREMNEPTASVKCTPRERGREKYTDRKGCRRKFKNRGGGGEESALEPGLCNGNHMVGGCGSDAPRLLGGAAKQPDTFQETGGKHFLGLNPRQHSLHQEERNERAREGGKERGGEEFIEDQERRRTPQDLPLQLFF